MIPKIFHFINIGPRSLSLVHYLSVMSAIQLNQPDKVHIYVDHEPLDFFSLMLKEAGVRFILITPPLYFKGVELTTYQYMADVIRLEKLLEYGGVYMDLDLLSLKPLGDLFNNSLVLSGESSHNDIKDKNDLKSVANAIIMSVPDHPFIKRWYNEISNNIIGKEWAYHAVVLPRLLLDGYEDNDIHIEPTVSFFPFTWNEDYIFTNEGEEKLKDSYCIHLWETIWRDRLKEINRSYFYKNTNNFTKLFSKYLK